MSKRMNLVGEKFGKLTVISFYDVKHGHSRWVCECDCGSDKQIIADGVHLKRGNIKSCGCLKVSCAKGLSEMNKKFNTYDLSGECGIGYTSKGEEFYFDLEDYDLIKDYCWHITKDGYVVRTGEKSMHSLVMNVDDKKIDHKQHKKNDNRKSQLRICSTQENNMNKTISKNNTSSVTGVYWNKKYNKWWSSIKVNNKSIYLGSFTNFDDAVKARKQAEEKYFGEFSYDNSMNNIEKEYDVCQF